MVNEFGILEAFGKRIKFLRQARGLTQEKLSEITGLDRTYISMVERGKRNISLKNIDRLAEALNISLPRLFDGF